MRRHLQDGGSGGERREGMEKECQREGEGRDWQSLDPSSPEPCVRPDMRLHDCVLAK